MRPLDATQRWGQTARRAAELRRLFAGLIEEPASVAEEDAAMRYFCEESGRDIAAVQEEKRRVLRSRVRRWQ